MLGLDDSDAMHMKHQLSPEDVVLFLPGVFALAVLDYCHPVLDIDEVGSIDRILLNHHLLIDRLCAVALGDRGELEAMLTAVALGILAPRVVLVLHHPVVDDPVADVGKCHMGWDDLVLHLTMEPRYLALGFHLLELTPSVILLVGVVLLDGLGVYAITAAVEHRIVLGSELVQVPWHDKYFLCKKLVHILLNLMFDVVDSQGFEPHGAMAGVKTKNKHTRISKAMPIPNTPVSCPVVKASVLPSREAREMIDEKIEYLIGCTCSVSRHSFTTCNDTLCGTRPTGFFCTAVLPYNCHVCAESVSSVLRQQGCEAFVSCEVLPLSPPAVMGAWGVVSTHAVGG